jgi:hypothetical protein
MRPIYNHFNPNLPVLTHRYCLATRLVKSAHQSKGLSVCLKLFCIQLDVQDGRRVYIPLAFANEYAR